MNKFITRYFSANQQRLELLYIGFRKYKRSSPEHAQRLFKLFSHDLAQHMQWDQNLIFPLLQAFGEPPLDELIHKARAEQQKIRQQVDAVEHLLRKGQESHDDEQRLEYLLSDHFENQEFDLYPACDRLFDTDTVTRLTESLSSSPR
ncbi:hemerythrin domain-containing protein [Bowmanella denitrificans]|uniref:hemerythrin domain-containing protein n=1 Tax=Bowmanella denitrificans TaxID=366582 RepID=UPI0015594C86|nr:hemerythrin domain-containing protein [Bowmanella denitrificans]